MALSIKRTAARYVEDFFEPIFNAVSGEIWTQNLGPSEAMGSLREHMKSTGPWNIMVGWWNRQNPMQLLDRARTWVADSVKVHFLSNCHMKAWFLTTAGGEQQCWWGSANLTEPTQGNRMKLDPDVEANATTRGVMATWPRTEYSSALSAGDFENMAPCEGPVIRGPGLVIAQGRFVPNYADDQRAQGSARYTVIDPISSFTLGARVPPCPQQINITLGAGATMSGNTVGR